MRRGLWAALLGLFVGVLGAAAWLSPAGPFVENAGLTWLFKARGPVDAPQDVVIVSIDGASADRLGLPPDPEEWPRGLHTDLIDELVRRGAAVIVFDLWFEDSGDGDAALKNAIERSERVVLFESMKRDGTLERPTQEFADAAIGLAPWAVPAGTVRYVWNFFTSNRRSAPTLPIVALQVRALPHVDELYTLLKQAGLPAPARFPTDRGDWAAEYVTALMQVLRRTLRDNRDGYETLLESVRENADADSSIDQHKQLLHALVRAYGGEDRFYLNYYGPSGAIETIPYVEVNENAAGAGSASAADLSGKVVFVGAVGLSTPGAQDDHDTVFSSQLSGVEIAATAFGNLLTDRAIKPLNDAAGAGIALALGLLVGLFAYVLRGIYAAAAVVALGGAYFAVAAYLFAAHAVWVPVLIPTAFQLPVGLFLGLYWKYRNVRVTHATCLSTDIEQFTKLSERMTREKRELELRAMMTKYFRMIGRIVRRSRGKVSHSGDDSTMNFWDAPQEDRSRRLDACLGAIKIARAVARFNQEQGDTGLPTRFGLDAGEVIITTTGDGRQESYSVDVGDAANAANRIEGLNKKLGTRVLASEAVVGDLDGLLLQPVGTFLVEGKNEPLPVFEIMCLKRDAGPADRQLCERFTAALRAYQFKQWSEAIALFESLISSCRGNGPSQYYLRLCQKYRAEGAPPEHPVIREEK